VDLDQNYVVFVVDANTANELFNSGKGRERGGHMGGSCILHLGVWDNQMEIVFNNKRSDAANSYHLIIILPSSPRLVVGAGVDWQQFFR